MIKETQIHSHPTQSAPSTQSPATNAVAGRIERAVGGAGTGPNPLSTLQRSVQHSFHTHANYDHAGRPGQVGGSAPKTFGTEAEANARAKEQKAKRPDSDFKAIQSKQTKRWSVVEQLPLFKKQTQTELPLSGNDYTQTQIAFTKNFNVLLNAKSIEAANHRGHAVDAYAGTVSDVLVPELVNRLPAVVHHLPILLTTKIQGFGFGVKDAAGNVGLYMNPEQPAADYVKGLIHEIKHAIDHFDGKEVTKTVGLSDTNYKMYRNLPSEKRAVAFETSFFQGLKSNAPKKPRHIDPLRYDPTATLPIRERWTKDLEQRFKRLEDLIVQAVETNNVLGLQTDVKANSFEGHAGRPGMVGGSVAYHVTQTENVLQIKKQGLRLMKTSNWVKAKDKKRYGQGQVYAFTHPQDAVKWAAKMDWEFNHKIGSGKISIVKIKRTGEWENDPAQKTSGFESMGAKGQWLRRMGNTPPADVIDTAPVEVKHTKRLVDDSGVTDSDLFGGSNTPKSNADLNHSYHQYKGACEWQIRPAPKTNSLLTNAAPSKRAYAFNTSDQKIDNFLAWLKAESDREILGITKGPKKGVSILGKRWSDIYITSSYKQGIAYAWNMMKDRSQPSLPISKIVPAGKDPVMTMFNAPVHADRVGLLYARTYEDLKGITAAMSQQIGRSLAEGMAEGRSPFQMARILTNRVQKVGLSRARTMARTEVIRAHHVANMTTYQAAGIRGVAVVAEFLGTDDEKMCETCAKLEGKRFTIKAAMKIIPVHPNCRCVCTPVVDEGKGFGKVQDEDGDVEKMDEDDVLSEIADENEDELATNEQRCGCWRFHRN